MEQEGRGFVRARAIGEPRVWFSEVRKHEKEPLVYTVQEVADLLRCNVKTVYQLIHDGRLRTVKLGRTYRVTPAALNEYLEGDG